MPDEQDESLGVDQLPQTELDATPGRGEERPAENEEASQSGVATKSVESTDQSRQG
jgi:hypothetical protein